MSLIAEAIKQFDCLNVVKRFILLYTSVQSLIEYQNLFVQKFSINLKIE